MWCRSFPVSAPSSTATIPTTSPPSCARPSRFSVRRAACSDRIFRSRNCGRGTPISSPPTGARSRPWAQRPRARRSTIRRPGFIGSIDSGYVTPSGEECMALEIKILDYGDIELESSFLVLGRDCGRTRRVPTLGFLILGGTWPIVIDTGYRSNQIMEILGMRGLQYHENMIENQLKRHGVRMGDVRFVCHTHLHIDHAGKDDLFPMNT